MIVDSNMYWLPEKIFTDEKLMSRFLSDIPQGYGTKGYANFNNTTGLTQINIEKPNGFQNLNYMQGEYLLEAQLADMDKACIDKAVLKLPGCHEWMSLEMCKLFNNEIANHVKQSNGRLFALAVVPPWGNKECIYELERCKNELGMTGVQVCAHYGNLYLDNEAFKPFFEKLNEWKMPVYVHHTPVPVQFDSLYEYNNLRRSYGRCVDQVTAIGRELFSDFFKINPNLKMIHSMLGGGFFAISNMLFPQKSKNTESVNRFHSDNDNVLGYLKSNIFFEMSHAQPWGKVQLECAITDLGADKILFGTSYPVRKEWLLEGVEFVNNLNISDEEKLLILGKNSQKLYCF